MNWKKFSFIILLLIGIVPRFLWLDKFPTGMSHDELEYIMSAKSYWENGGDLSGMKFPESIFRTQTNGVISFLPAMILAPYYGLVHLSQTTVRLPYSILNIITAGILYLWVKEVIKRKDVAVISVIVFLYSPWSFYFSRMASDTAWALFFGLVGLWLTWKQKNKYLWVGLVFFILAFFSYHGAKLVIPLVAVAGLIATKRTIKTATVYVGCVGIVMGGYFLTLKLLPNSIYNSRQSDIIFLNNAVLSGEVNHNRALTVNSKLTPIFENKLTGGINLFFKNYMGAFSPTVLFIEGDSRATYKFGGYGLLHKIDALLLVIGLVGIFLKRKKIGWFLVALGVVAPIATGLSTVEMSVINRSFLLLPVLVILISYGLFRIGKFSVLLLVPFWFYFLFFYFYQFPKINQESYFLSERIAANYIIRNNDKKIVIVSTEPRSMKLETMFYNQGKEINNTMFTNECPKIFNKDTVYLLANCKPNTEFVSINEEEFGGPLVYIVNDGLCKDFKLNPWVTREIGDYGVERLDNKSFCQRWITQAI